MLLNDSSSTKVACLSTCVSQNECVLLPFAYGNIEIYREAPQICSSGHIDHQNIAHMWLDEIRL